MRTFPQHSCTSSADARPALRLAERPSSRRIPWGPPSRHKLRQTGAGDRLADDTPGELLLYRGEEGDTQVLGSLVRRHQTTAGRSVLHWQDSKEERMLRVKQNRLRCGAREIRVPRLVMLLLLPRASRSG